MSTSKQKRKADDQHYDKSCNNSNTKRPKISSDNLAMEVLAGEYALIDLNSDAIFHVLEWASSASLLSLSISCSKFNNIVDSFMQSAQKILSFALKLNRSALKKTSRIEKAFNSRVRIMEIENNTNSFQHHIQILPWDSTKIIYATNNDKTIKIFCTSTGRDVSSMDFDNCIREVAIGSDVIALRLHESKKSAQIVVCTVNDTCQMSVLTDFVKTLPRNYGARSMAWTSTKDLIFFTEWGKASYQIYSTSGKLIREENIAPSTSSAAESEPHILVSPNGANIVFINYGPVISISQIEILTAELKGHDLIASRIENLRFITDDLIAGESFTFDGSDTFCYNLETKVYRHWIAWRTQNQNNSFTNIFNSDGTKLFRGHFKRELGAIIEDVETNQTLVKMAIEIPAKNTSREEFGAVFDWTNKTDHEPAEKLIWTTGANDLLVYDPISGERIAILDHILPSNTKQNIWCKALVSRDNRTIVFRSVGTTNTANYIVWSLQ